MTDGKTMKELVKAIVALEAMIVAIFGGRVRKARRIAELALWSEEALSQLILELEDVLALYAWGKENRVQCFATTNGGTRCKSPAGPGDTVCTKHLDACPVPEFRCTQRMVSGRMCAMPLEDSGDTCGYHYAKLMDIW